MKRLNITVGELKEALSQFDDNASVEFIAYLIGQESKYLEIERESSIHKDGNVVTIEVDEPYC